jgi:MFS family permease
MSRITKTVWILSLVSFFTDIASEMLYPIMPIYLNSIHFSVLFIGVLEGVAEATAGLSKGYFGKLSDNTGKRLPFVRIGYGLSAISKPMMAFSTWTAWILSARTMDRLGKGIRTGARDAILSDEATPGTKGAVFGFHRSMDTLGAVAGPSVALLFLYFHPAQYKTLFYIAFIPGVLAIAFTFFIKEKKTEIKYRQRTSFFDFLKYWTTSTKEYKRLVAGLLLFTLFNSSDVFLLLRMKTSGLSDTMTVGVYIFYNIVYAILSYPLGIIADKVGLKKIFLLGIAVFTLVYTLMAFNNSMPVFFALFFLYGIYAAATEGIAKAWITNVSERQDTATAIGTYTAFQSIGTLIASSLAGLIWYKYGAAATFCVTAIASGLLLIYFTSLKYRQPLSEQ